MALDCTSYLVLWYYGKQMLTDAYIKTKRKDQYFCMQHFQAQFLGCNYHFDSNSTEIWSFEPLKKLRKIRIVVSTVYAWGFMINIVCCLHVYVYIYIYVLHNMKCYAVRNLNVEWHVGNISYIVSYYKVHATDTKYTYAILQSMIYQCPFIYLKHCYAFLSDE